MLRSLPLLLLIARPASAARYDPDFDRAALRASATACVAKIVDATGRPLTPEQTPAITAGVDEGVRQAALAAAAARSLDAVARRRDTEMAAGIGAVDRALKELSEPVAAERARATKLAGELAALEEKIEALPDEARDKLRPAAAKAKQGLLSAGEKLRPAEDALKTMGERALEMKEARRAGLRRLIELSSDASSTTLRAESLPPAAAEVQERLGALTAEPSTRTRALEKIEILRGVARLLFGGADRACNRADEYRRVSASFEDAAGVFEKARPAAVSAAAGPFLDETQKTLAQIRESLKKHD